MICMHNTDFGTKFEGIVTTCKEDDGEEEEEMRAKKPGKPNEPGKPNKPGKPGKPGNNEGEGGKPEKPGMGGKGLCLNSDEVSMICMHNTDFVTKFEGIVTTCKEDDGEEEEEMRAKKPGKPNKPG